MNPRNLTTRKKHPNRRNYLRWHRTHPNRVRVVIEGDGNPFVDGMANLV